MYANSKLFPGMSLGLSYQLPQHLGEILSVISVRLIHLQSYVIGYN